MKFNTQHDLYNKRERIRVVNFIATKFEIETLFL